MPAASGEGARGDRPRTDYLIKPSRGLSEQRRPASGVPRREAAGVRVFRDGYPIAMVVAPDAVGCVELRAITWHVPLAVAVNSPDLVIVPRACSTTIHSTLASAVPFTNAMSVAVAPGASDSAFGRTVTSGRALASFT